MHQDVPVPILTAWLCLAPGSHHFENHLGVEEQEVGTETQHQSFDREDSCIVRFRTRPSLLNCGLWGFQPFHDSRDKSNRFRRQSGYTAAQRDMSKDTSTTPFSDPAYASKPYICRQQAGADDCSYMLLSALRQYSVGRINVGHLLGITGRDSGSPSDSTCLA